MHHPPIPFFSIATQRVDQISAAKVWIAQWDHLYTSVCSHFMFLCLSLFYFVRAFSVFQIHETYPVLNLFSYQFRTVALFQESNHVFHRTFQFQGAFICAPGNYLKYLYFLQFKSSFSSSEEGRRKYKPKDQSTPQLLSLSKAFLKKRLLFQ